MHTDTHCHTDMCTHTDTYMHSNNDTINTVIGILTLTFANTDRHIHANTHNDILEELAREAP